jgi:hypothetical protein
LSKWSILIIEVDKEKSDSKSDNDSDILKKEIQFNDNSSQGSDRDKWDKGIFWFYMF